MCEDLPVLIPVTGNAAKRDQQFMFIACQNDTSTIGRKKLPENIESRLRTFEYPLPELSDLMNNCKSITKYELSAEKDGGTIAQINAENIAK